MKVGYCELLKLVTWTPYVLFPQLERRGFIFKNLEVGLPFNESNQIPQPICINYPNIWFEAIVGFTQILRAIDFEDGWFITQNERKESTLIEIHDKCDMFRENLKISFLITPCVEIKKGREWRGIIERGKMEENEKGQSRNARCVC